MAFAILPTHSSSSEYVCALVPYPQLHEGQLEKGRARGPLNRSNSCGSSEYTATP